ncbi:MAG: hypothetical protein ABSF60_10080 [Verrucomicrobiota bacterium]
MEVKFNFTKEDLFHARLAGLGESPAVKVRRVVFILMPLLVMLVLTIFLQHLFHVEGANTYLIPGVLLGFAMLYIVIVISNRRYRARKEIEDKLKTDSSMLGDYTMDIQDPGLSVAHNGKMFWPWESIQSILANWDCCHIQTLDGKEVVIVADKIGGDTAFQVFVRLCVTLHYFQPRLDKSQPKKKVKLDASNSVWKTHKINTEDGVELKMAETKEQTDKQVRKAGNKPT